MRFLTELETAHPRTAEILAQGNLVLHPAVARVALHGSRGPAGGFRPDSDLDLSLIVDVPAGDGFAAGPLLREVIERTHRAWAGQVELDLAAVFDTRGCGLACFEAGSWSPADCPGGGVDCFGLYKTQKGFIGFVEHAGVEVRRMRPCLVIWRR